jgi:hypothetical protein
MSGDISGLLPLLSPFNPEKSMILSGGVQSCVCGVLMFLGSSTKYLVRYPFSHSRNRRSCDFLTTEGITSTPGAFISSERMWQLSYISLQLHAHRGLSLQVEVIFGKVMRDGSCGTWNMEQVMWHNLKVPSKYAVEMDKISKSKCHCA